MPKVTVTFIPGGVEAARELNELPERVPTSSESWSLATTRQQPCIHQEGRACRFFLGGVFPEIEYEPDESLSTLGASS